MHLVAVLLEQHQHSIREPLVQVVLETLMEMLKQDALALLVVAVAELLTVVQDMLLLQVAQVTLDLMVVLVHLVTVLLVAVEQE
jgi:hypothetical protein